MPSSWLVSQKAIWCGSQRKHPQEPSPVPPATRTKSTDLGCTPGTSATVYRYVPKYLTFSTEFMCFNPYNQLPVTPLVKWWCAHPFYEFTKMYRNCLPTTTTTMLTHVTDCIDQWQYKEDILSALLEKQIRKITRYSIEELRQLIQIPDHCQTDPNPFLYIEYETHQSHTLTLQLLQLFFSPVIIKIVTTL